MTDTFAALHDVNAELTRAHERLQAGTDPERVLEELSLRVTNKLLHPLIVELRSRSVGCRSCWSRRFASANR